MQKINSAGRMFPRATKHGADEEAITASVEWIMVHMDLLAYCK